jgi:hypothetical protein
MDFSLKEFSCKDINMNHVNALGLFIAVTVICFSTFVHANQVQGKSNIQPKILSPGQGSKEVVDIAPAGEAPKFQQIKLRCASTYAEAANVKETELVLTPGSSVLTHSGKKFNLVTCEAKEDEKKVLGQKNKEEEKKIVDQKPSEATQKEIQIRAMTVKMALLDLMEVTPANAAKKRSAYISFACVNDQEELVGSPIRGFILTKGSKVFMKRDFRFTFADGSLAKNFIKNVSFTCD